MTDTLFLAGATGVIGRQLLPLLIDRGWHVFGTTRRSDRAAALRAAGAIPVIVDVFDREALLEAVRDASPTVVVHQLTDLPPALAPAEMEAASTRNARLRDEGTRNLVDAAVSAGATRLVAQSIAFAYAEGPLPYRESDPLDIDAPGRPGVSARGVAALERAVLNADLIGIVLRFGRLYGPGTGADAPSGAAPLHVTQAAAATLLAIERGQPGVYNIAEDDGAVDVSKARLELGWPAA